MLCRAFCPGSLRQMPHLSQLSYQGMAQSRHLHPACIHGLAIVHLRCPERISCSTDMLKCHVHISCGIVRAGQQGGNLFDCNHSSMLVLVQMHSSARSPWHAGGRHYDCQCTVAVHMSAQRPCGPAHAAVSMAQAELDLQSEPCIWTS